MSNNVAIIGGAGFIGTHLMESLRQDPALGRIYVLDLVPPQVLDDRIEFVRCDIRQPIDFSPAVKIDACYHLAAVCREPGFEWNEYFLANYQGTQNLCSWASKHGIENLIFTSTAMVFRASDQRHDEQSLPDPDTAYGISKALAEEVVKAWRGARPSRRLHIIRPGVVFGRGGGGNFARLYKSLRYGLFFYIGRRSTVKSTIYVKDLVRLLQFAAQDQQPLMVYHGVYREATTVESICAAFCKAFKWRRHTMTIPYQLAFAAALAFQALNTIGLKNPVHYRRIQKLYHSTNLSSENLAKAGFELSYSLEDALLDWRSTCSPHAPF
jgi:nucleoside-diphosphate-sugar epimerase